METILVTMFGYIKLRMTNIHVEEYGSLIRNVIQKPLQFKYILHKQIQLYESM
jgi:hypothetical protein